MNKVLTIVDTAGIQDYVFRTNKLRQIIGASYLVNAATKDWVEEVLGDENLSKRIYSGGGNAMLLFDSMDEASDFATELSKICIDRAPGLRLVVAHKEFDYDTVALGGEKGVINQVFELLSKLKAEGNAWQLETSLGVTQNCPYTSQPVVVESLEILEENELPISAEALAKTNAKENALAPKFTYKGDKIPREYAFAEEIDKITGKNSSKNLIAIIHIDGNDIGTKITNLVKLYDEEAKNSTLLKELVKFSDKVNKVSKHALDETINHLASKLDGDDLILTSGNIIELHTKEGITILPIRPIVLGGDDLTLICDGRIALDLTVKYLQVAQTQTLADDSPYYCKAGVCIVKRHFPFYPAYQLSLQLSSSAKALGKEVEEDMRYSQIPRWEKVNKLKNWPYEIPKFSSLDWQICLNGIKGKLHEIRTEEYSGENGQLNLRPLALNNFHLANIIEDLALNTSWSWRTWERFKELFDEMNNPDILPRNKAKLLREILREESVVIDNFLKLNRIDVNQLSYPSGWNKNRSAYFDALELQDIYEEL